MSKTAELLERLPESVLNYAKRLKKDYNNGVINNTEVRSEMVGFINGLNYSGVLNDTERRLLFCWMTL